MEATGRGKQRVAMAAAEGAVAWYSKKGESERRPFVRSTRAHACTGLGAAATRARDAAGRVA
jgi:hypothetical protein